MYVKFFKRMFVKCTLIFIMGVSISCKKTDTNTEDLKNQEVETNVSLSYVVDFVDYDGSILKTQEVDANKNATAPPDPVREGFIFMGWDEELTNVIQDMTVEAQYLENNKPVLMMNSAVAHAGDSSIEMLVSVKNNPGILGMTLSVEYDENVMMLTDATNGDAVSDVLTLTASNVLESGCRFAWDGQELFEDDIKDGTILVLSFDILENIDDGTYEITLSYEDIYDNDVLPLTMDVKSGAMTIS